MEEKLILYSKLAFYPMHWEAFKYLRTHYAVRGTVIANTPPLIPSVHQQLGWIDPQREPTSFDVRLMPQVNKAAKALWLRRELRYLQPDVIWVQEEPTDPYLLEMLTLYRFKQTPRIVTAVCENIFEHWQIRWFRPVWRFLWSRLDALLPVAPHSLAGVQAAGMPRAIPAQTLVAGMFAPPDRVAPLSLPFARTADDFVVGYVGRICEEKGWKVLLTALESLPPNYKCVLAGDGLQRDELKSWLAKPGMKDRAFFLGLLPREPLYGLYRSLDVLVIPSLTTRRWKEQNCGVALEGLSMGLPLIGSDSGGIPDIIGSGGMIVPENEPKALAAALRQLYVDPEQRRRLGEAGRQQFLAEFEISAYARKIARGLQLRERSIS